MRVLIPSLIVLLGCSTATQQSTTPLLSEKPTNFVAYDNPPELIGNFSTLKGFLKYPQRALSEKVEGTVRILAIITPTGGVDSVSVIEENPSGYGFGLAAMEAVSQLRWRPAKKDGKPIWCRITMPVPFKLDK
jgi:TonB family protein